MQKRLSMAARTVDQGSKVVGTGVPEHTHQPRLFEERFWQAQKMEITGQLTSGVVHDFNNLVTVISGYSAILLNHLSHDDPLYEAAEEIKKAGQRAASLTRQLLAFSRKQVIEPSNVPLNPIVRDIEKMLRRLIGEDIKLVTVLEPTIGCVLADPGQIEQVIVNLAVNARDAMPQGGRLTITTENVAMHEDEIRQYHFLQPMPYVKLTVSDTGCGMDAETRAHLFEPFFTTKKRGKGTGLGLATVYKIVKNLQGAIWVDSAPSLGTTFKIALPQAEQTVKRCNLPSTPEEPPYGSETVLIVDDEDAVRALVSCTLQRYGYTVLEAPHGKAALLTATRHNGPIHLLLTDVVMPHMSGHDLVRRLTPLRPDMKILYMSGYTDGYHIPQDVLDAPAAFIGKPFTPQALACRVRQMLDMPSEAGLSL